MTIKQFITEMYEDTAPVKKALLAYNQPHRFYHNITHIETLFKQIKSLNKPCDKKLLYMIALFHDIVYNPSSKTNETESADCFITLNKYLKKQQLSKADIELILRAILNTGADKNYTTSGLSNIFNKLDYSYLMSDDLSTELKIFKEYQYVDTKTYISKRIEFLEKNVLHKETISEDERYKVRSRINFMEHFKPKIGLFVGSFNNFHIGHMNILEKAEQIFDKVIVMPAYNPKKGAYQDVSNVEQVLPYHEIIRTPDLISKFLEDNKDLDITVVKGLRDSNDFSYELNIYKFMQDLYKNIKVVYIPCDRELEHISSSAINSLDIFGADTYKYYPTKFNYKGYW